MTLDTTLVVRRSTAAPEGLVTELWRDPSAPGRRRRVSRPVSPDDARGEGRPAVRRLGRRPRRSARWRPMLPRRHGTEPPWEELIADGLGQLTRPFGTAPVEPGEGLRALAERQRAGDGGQPVRDPRPGARGVPDRAGRLAGHDLPVAAVLGGDLRPRARRADGRADRRRPCARLGVHQGLAPVLDVVRDLRWGRVEETMGEDPFLVGLIGSAYVRGAGERRRRRHAQALRRLLRLPGRAEPRAGVDGPARAGRRDPAAVRDGAAGRRPVGDELLHRHRRRTRRRRPCAC